MIITSVDVLEQQKDVSPLILRVTFLVSKNPLTNFGSPGTDNAENVYRLRGASSQFMWEDYDDTPLKPVVSNTVSSLAAG